MPKLEKLKSLFPIFAAAEFGCGAGWYDLLLDYGIDLSAYAKKHGLAPTISVVRSKLGRLRVFVRCPSATDAQWDEIEKIHERHEVMSGATCEQCGRKGRRVIVDKAVFTLCKACHHVKRCE